MKHADNGTHTGGVRLQWKVFFGIFIVTASVFAVLWSLQVVLIGNIHGSIKTAELKKATNAVGDMLAEGSTIISLNEAFSTDDINIRIIDLASFEDIFTDGDGHVSASRDIGDYEILKLYNLARENGGEISQYYRYDKQKEYYLSFRLPEKSGDNPLPDPQQEDDDAEPSDTESRPSMTHEQGIGVRFFKGHPPFLLSGSERYVDDFLYVRLVNAPDAEYMIIADIQVTPLDSTIRILKTLLGFATVVAVLVSLVVSYFVSRSIARPIEDLNREALDMAHGHFGTTFSGKGYREIEELSETLTYTARELGRVDEFRREMLANVSHDLRTPLTMIGGYAEMMRDIPGENTPENAQVIIDEAKRLTDFVNNILDLSKLESGMDISEATPVDLTAMLDGIRTRYEGLVGKAGCRIEYTHGAAVYVSGDEEKLTQAFNNLIDNAVNHTGDDKTVYIREQLIKNTVRVEITDTGSGIPKEELPYIWDRYYRGSKTHKRAIIGSGIGLSIVKAVFEQHHLRYGVESSESCGTTFFVEFERIPAPKDNT